MKKILILLTILILLLSSPLYADEILKIGYQEDIKTLNYFKATDRWSTNVLNCIYESLYVYSPETYKITPWLAESYPKINNTEKTAEVKLRNNILWSDGRFFTADDVVFTAQVCMNYKIPIYKSNWEFIEKVEKIDDTTVKYYFKEMRATFLHKTLMQIIKPRHIWEKLIENAIKGKTDRDILISILNITPTETQTIGTGPYIIKEWSKSQFISLKSNPNYHMKNKIIQGSNKQYKIGPFLDGILFRIFRSMDSVIESIKKGDIDYIWSDISPDKVAKLNDELNIELTTNQQNSIFYVGFNIRRSPFKYKAFRQAMATLVDRNYIKEKILKNYGEVMISIVPPGNTTFYNKDVEDYGTRAKLPKNERESKARALLENAGFSWGSDGMLIDPIGNKVPPFYLLTTFADYDPVRSVCGFIISEWWNAIGVPVTAKPTSFGEMLDKVFTERNFDVYILGWELTVFPSYLRDYFHSSQDEPDGSNTTGFNSPDYDELSDTFIKELDIATQIIQAKKLQERLADECPYIPLYTTASIEAHSRRYAGWLNQLNGTGNIWSLLFLKR